MRVSESFMSYGIPFPITVSDLSAPGQNMSNTLAEDFIPLSNPLFEFNVCQ